MDKKPRTKEVVRSVKEHAADSIKDKVSQVGIRGKEKAVDKVQEQLRPADRRQQKSDSPENYATETVEEKAEQTADTAMQATKNTVRKAVKTVKEKRRQTKESAQEEAEAEPMPETDASEPVVGDEPEPVANDEPNTGETKNTSDTVRETKATDSKTTEPKTERQSEKKTDPSTTESKPTDAKKDASAKKKQATAKGKERPGDDTPEQSVKKDKAGKSAERPKAAEDLSDAPSEKKKPKQADLRNIRQKSQAQASAKTHTRAAPKQPEFIGTAEAPEKVMQPRTKHKTPPKTRVQQTVKSVGNNARQVRKAETKMQSVRSVERKANMAIKKADKAYKTAEKTAKTAKKTAETTAKAAKRAEETARVTAKAAAKATAQTTKAVVAAIKASVTAMKELIAAIASGGTTALVIIIVVCLIAAIGGTCFGIFLSNDKTTGTKITMTEAISQLTTRHYSEITNVKAKYDYDTMEITASSGGTAINWKDVLAVYAVKTTTSKENGYEVVTTDDVKLKLLKKVMDDMNEVTYTITPKTVTENVTTTDANGKTVSKPITVTKKILTVDVKRMTVDEIVEKYKFNADQKKQLTELMSKEYDDLWAELIGNAGTVIVSDSTYVPTNIFAWPLSINGTISSRYGYRSDPATGVLKLHGGTDIAAPTGTPILAAADGTVIAAAYNAGGYGYYVKIKHEGVISTLYGHCSVLHVTTGQQVKQGQLIAEVGSTGYSTGPHLHFEVRINDVRVDAMQYFR